VWNNADVFDNVQVSDLANNYSFLCLANDETSSEMTYLQSYGQGAVEVYIFHHNTVESDDFLGLLASIEYPQATVTFTIPSPYPASWLQASSDVKNDGSSASFYIQVNSADNSTASSCCGTVWCVTEAEFAWSHYLSNSFEPTFDMTCQGSASPPPTSLPFLPTPPPGACNAGTQNCPW
jgi:hypothetical protein